ncbi:MAG: 50S ribosomal protein L4 [Candidatus Nealsonbacteria bacterium]|nr:MAG: 50S ribosomal protein L4 [Candidatus Nealsonbacteria bacterium]
MLVKCYDQQGKVVSQTRLPSEVFGVKLNPDLVHQVALSQMANRRRVIAHTKDRSEVRGGGRKPWRQKGTGRARAGSIRSPIWRGGGVTFGPTKKKVFKKKINKKMRRRALLQVLSFKAQNNFLIILDKMQLAEPKTKLMAKIMGNLPCKEGSRLIALPGMDKNIIRAARNLPKTEFIQAKDLNVLDLLSFKYLVMPKESIKVIKDNFVK